MSRKKSATEKESFLQEVQDDPVLKIEQDIQPQYSSNQNAFDENSFNHVDQTNTNQPALYETEAKSQTVDSHAILNPMPSVIVDNEHDTNHDTTSVHSRFHQRIISHRPSQLLGINDESNLRRYRVRFSSVVKNYKQKKDINYLRKKAIFNFLEYPNTVWAYIYLAVSFLVVIVSIFFNLLFTLHGMQFKEIYICNFIFDIIVLVWLIIELGLRIYSCNSWPQYMKEGRLSYVKNYSSITDIIVICITFVIIILFLFESKNDKVVAAVNIIQMFQVLRFVHFDKYIGALRLMMNILFTYKRELSSAYFLLIFTLLTFSYIYYYTEIKSSANTVSSIPESFYFSVITFFTIGFGDLYPTTVPGKTVVMVIAFIGIALASIPAGIIGSGFAIGIEKSRKYKEKQRIIPLAVRLIQTKWRYYSLKKFKTDSATFKALNFTINVNYNLYNPNNNSDNNWGTLTPKYVTEMHSYYTERNSTTNKSLRYKNLLSLVKQKDDPNSHYSTMLLLKIIYLLKLHQEWLNWRSLQNTDSVENLLHRIHKNQAFMLDQMRAIFNQNNPKSMLARASLEYTNTDLTQINQRYVNQRIDKLENKLDLVIKALNEMSNKDSETKKIEV